MTSNHINRRLLFAYLGLVTFVLSVQLSLHFLPNVIARNADGEDLQGNWQYCWTIDPKLAKPCHWQTVSFPASAPKGEAQPNSILVVKKKFHTPDSCRSPSAFCTLFIGTVSDPATVFLNGTLVGTVGNPGKRKSYTQTFPVSITIPPDRFAEENTLAIRIHPNYLGNQGLIRGPIHLFSADTASWISRIVISQTIALPLISGVILLLLFFAMLLIVAGSHLWDAKIRSFLGYCLTMGLYLISLTRLPREVLPPELGIALHFALRAITEYFHFGLITEVFERRPTWIRLVRLYAISLFALLVVPSLSALWGYPLPEIAAIARFLYRGSVALFVVPPILCICFILTMNREERKAFVPLSLLYMVVCGMIISDFLAINGLIEDIYFVRFYPLLVALGYCSALWISYSRLREKFRTDLALGRLSAQVAHDIRSPLSALAVIASDIRSLPESHRALLRAAVDRINDIASGLLEARRSRSISHLAGLDSGKMQPEPLGALIASIVSEKRAQYRDRTNIEINYEAIETYGAFSNVNATTFARILSNIVNNAVEAMSGEKGRVEIRLESSSREALVTVFDNGPGIPKEIVRKIGTEELTQGKVGGSGLGLYHATRALRDWNGALRVTSSIGSGTKVQMQLPLAEPPKWWTPSIKLHDKSRVIVLDDDRSIFHLWEKRLRGLLETGPLYFSSTQTFRAWWRDHRTKDDLILTDFEFRDEETTGLALVEILHIADQSILVTSRHEQVDVVEGCVQLGIKMIPKLAAMDVPIEIEERKQKPLDAVLLDDDPLVQSAWMLSAKRCGKKLQTMSSLDEPGWDLTNIPRNTPIYVDLELGGSNDGMQVARRLHDLGFTAVFLTSSSKASSPSNLLPWTQGIIGKLPPWSALPN